MAASDFICVWKKWLTVWLLLIDWFLIKREILYSIDTIHAPVGINLDYLFGICVRMAIWFYFSHTHTHNYCILGFGITTFCIELPLEKQIRSMLLYYMGFVYNLMSTACFKYSTQSILGWFGKCKEAIKIKC